MEKISSELRQQRIRQYQEQLWGRPDYQTAISDTCKALEKELQSPVALDTELYLYAVVPMLMEYVGWVLREAQRTGKERLYFLARDGYQMYLMAQVICKMRNLSIECRYLSVSRFAIRVPEYHLNLEKSLDRICVGGIDVTFSKIMKRAALSEEEAGLIARTCGWVGREEEILNLRQIEELKLQLRNHARLLQYIDMHSRQEYENAVGYLEQEGLMSEGIYALVDSGWVGTLQQSIQELVHSRRPDIRLEGYYFGMYEYPEGADRSTYHAYYFSPGRGLRRKVHFSNSLYESICSAPEGMTVRYEHHDLYSPKLDQKYNPNIKQMQRNIHALVVWLRFYQKTEEHVFISNEESRRLVDELVIRFMGKPTQIEVEAYGNNLFSDDVLEGDLKYVAAKLTEKEILDQRFLNKLLILAGVRKAKIRESAWIEGSAVRLNRHVASNLRHIAWYKYFVYGRKQIQSGRRR